MTFWSNKKIYLATFVLLFCALMYSERYYIHVKHLGETQNLSSVVAAPLWSLDRTLLQQFVKILTNNTPGLLKIEIYNEDDTVFAESQVQEDDVFIFPRWLHQNRFFKNQEVEETVLYENHPIGKIHPHQGPTTLPARIAMDYIGAVRIATSIEPAVERAQDGIARPHA